ncbi:MAG: 2-phosphosulfolactate phosphatase, partial [Ktedonobacterales bacterium]
ETMLWRAGRMDEYNGAGYTARRRVALRVALIAAQTPTQPERRARTVFIVVDVIRATTTLCVMCERGCLRIYVARTVEAARAVRPAMPDVALLGGEAGGLTPAGFDLGNSPVEWAAQQLAGRPVLFSSTNGARALHACRGGGPIFGGSIRNASAVAAAAVDAVAELAVAAVGRRDDELDDDDISDGAPSIAIVCSGKGDQPAYDDTLCAAIIARAILRLSATTADDPQRVAVIPDESARIALATLDQYEALVERGVYGSLGDALATSGAARAITSVGLGADVALCADLDVTDVVPLVTSYDTERDLLLIAPMTDDT